MCILHLWHISIKSTHILNAEQPHVSMATKADDIGLNDILQTGNSDHFWNGLCCFFFCLFFFVFCSEFCHTLEWNSHGFTCVPHPDPPSHLPLHPLPLGFPSAPGPSTCLMHPTWAGDLFHPIYYTCVDAVLLKHPTLSFSHRVQKTVL